MNEKGSRQISIQYIVLLLLYFPTAFYISRTSRPDGVMNFMGWDAWKASNKEGYDCSVRFERKPDRIILTTENFGIHITNITYISGDKEVYAALTGDQVALTGIRIVR